MNTCSVKPRRKQNRLNSILKHHKGRIALCILLAVTGSLMSAGIRTAVGDAVDRFRQGEAAFGIFYGAAAAAALYLLSAAGLGRCRRMLSAAVSIDLDAVIEQRTLSLGMNEAQAVTSGALTTLITQDKRLVNGAVERVLMRMLPDCCLWAAGVAAIGRISLWLAAAAVLISVLTVLWFAVWSKSLQVRQDSYLKALEALNNLHTASLETLETCKAWHDEARDELQSDEQTRYILRASSRIHRMESLISIPSTACAFFILLGIVFSAGLLCVKGQITTGQALAAVLLVDTVCNPAMSMDNSIRAFRRAQASWRRIAAFLEPPEPESAGHALTLQAQPGICVKDVSFAYDAEKPILRRFTRTFVPGRPYCICGANGSGKSTLFYLIAGVLTPQGGQIAVGAPSDGHPAMAVCTQDLCAFQTTIRENICGDLPCDEERLHRIARAVDLHDEILQTPGGYDTVLGENGEPLSRGQRQRLSICRTLYQDADILLFDEPTSALDEAHTRRFFAYLQTAAQTKTILLITHDAAGSFGFETVAMEVPV